MKTGVDCHGKEWTKRKLRKNAKDLTNQSYNLLTAYLPITILNTKRTGWLCKCKCGAEIAVETYAFTSGWVKSCGKCSYKETRKEQALTMIGQRFGRLVVKELSYSKEGRGFCYRCQCDCGEEITTLGIALRCGNTKSCGHCTRKESQAQKREDLTGQTFGWLTVENFSHTDGKRAYYKCLCRCGNHSVVGVDALKSGNTTSCGCRKSIGEANIRQILENNNISFQPQYSFKDLRSNSGGVYKYDFALLDENKNVIRLIEFDGKQHFSASGSGWSGNEETFKQIQINDNLKNQYAFNHNIPLVRIPYTERDNITLDLLLGDKYLLHSPS